MKYFINPFKWLFLYVEAKVIRFFRLLFHVITDLWRNKLVSFATIIVITVVIFAFNMVLILNFMAYSTLQSIHEEMDINVDILETASDFQVQGLISDLRAKPEVKQVVYISRDDALDTFKTFFPSSGLVEFLEKYDEPNPLPVSIGIITNSVHFNTAILDYLQNSKFSEIIDLNKLDSNIAQQERTEQFMSITNAVYTGGYILMIIFLLISVLVIYNAIRIMIYTREKEIEVMRLVGARYIFIRLPFLIEGSFYGLLSVSFALIFLFLLLSHLETIASVSFLEVFQGSVFMQEFISFFYDSFLLIAFLEMLFVAFLGLISSYYAVHRHLKAAHLS